ncbi:hypothetical protein [Paenibacillus oleatilyticus]|uniref:Uncharacterized protein n=1 Tax=Paenibacillus oleatilyticus TaxID=2594886 RepID=A0ABV4UYR9_9BACL
MRKIFLFVIVLLFTLSSVSNAAATQKGDFSKLLQESKSEILIYAEQNNIDLNNVESHTNERILEEVKQLPKTKKLINALENQEAFRPENQKKVDEAYSKYLKETHAKLKVGDVINKTFTFKDGSSVNYETKIRRDSSSGSNDPISMAACEYPGIKYDFENYKTIIPIGERDGLVFMKLTAYVKVTKTENVMEYVGADTNGTYAVIPYTQNSSIGGTTPGTTVTYPATATATGTYNVTLWAPMPIWSKSYSLNISITNQGCGFFGVDNY